MGVGVSRQEAHSGVAVMAKRKRNKATLELEPPWAEYRKQQRIQEAVDPVRLKAERDRCRQLLDGSISWDELLGRR